MLCLSLFKTIYLCCVCPYLKQYIIKQLLDSVFVVSGIINVSVSVISLDLDFFGYNKNTSNNLIKLFFEIHLVQFFIFLKANYSLGEL